MSLSAACYEQRVEGALRDLGIPLELIRRRKLPLCPEAASLVVVEVDARGRELRLSPPTADAWRTMKAAAAESGVALHLISGYRSFDRQCDIVREKLARGQMLADILSVSAPPGFSEHHTGRAVDIGASPDDPLEDGFERSPAYAWLLDHAAQHDFHLSYPRDNPYGYRYEPWHWLHGGRVS